MNEELPAFVEVCALYKSYQGGVVQAVQGADFRVGRGEVVSIMGPSGCGKSTLLSLIGALDRPSGGKIVIDGEDLANRGALHRFRAQTIGFVFQFHHLVPTLTLLENVETPMVALGVGKRERRERAQALLSEVGLEKRLHFRPSQISGGERQRAAVARALINMPQLIIADEPTGNLDSENGDAVIELLLKRSRHQGATVLLATHNPEIALRTDRVLQMRDGRVLAPC